MQTNDHEYADEREWIKSNDCAHLPGLALIEKKIRSASYLLYQSAPGPLTAEITRRCWHVRYRRVRPILQLLVRQYMLNLGNGAGGRVLGAAGGQLWLAWNEDWCG